MTRSAILRLVEFSEAIAWHETSPRYFDNDGNPLVTTVKDARAELARLEAIERAARVYIDYWKIPMTSEMTLEEVTGKLDELTNKICEALEGKL